MPKRSSLILGFLLISLFLPTLSLEAATYKFNPTNVVNNPLNSPDLNYEPSTFPIVSLSIQDSAVSSGFFSVSYSSSSAVFSGDYTSLISFHIGDSVDLSSEFKGNSDFRANLLFNTGGSVSTGALFYSSDIFEVDLAGSADLFQGAFVPSFKDYQGFVSGTFIAVPEPASIILLSVGLIGVILVFKSRTPRFLWPWARAYRGLLPARHRGLL